MDASSEDLDEEMLIALVKIHRELYDSTLPKYSDVIRKERIWNEIAKQLGHSVNKCRERWSNLRGSFRRAYRDHKGVNEKKSRKRLRRWKYEKKMEFLIPFLKIKYDSSDYPDDVNTETNQSEEITIKNETPSTPRSSFEADFPDSYSLAEALETNAQTARASSHYEHMYKIDRETDALRNFFAYLAETVRTFPPFMQVLAKSKCFNIISEMEISLVKENPDQCVVPQILVEQVTGGDEENGIRETSVLMKDESDDSDDEPLAKISKIATN